MIWERRPASQNRADAPRLGDTNNMMTDETSHPHFPHYIYVFMTIRCDIQGHLVAKALSLLFRHAVLSSNPEADEYS